MNANTALIELANSALRRAAERVVGLLQHQPSALSGVDSGLGNIWLEFCAQVQGEQSIDWEDFKLHVRQTIEGTLVELDRIEQQTLWLRTPAGRDWLDEPSIDTDDLPVDFDDLIELVYQRVYQHAIDCEDECLRRFLCGGSDGYLDDDPDAL